MRTWNRRREPNYSADHGYSRPPAQGEPLRPLWDEAFVAAKQYYTKARAPDPDVLSSNTAWKTVVLESNPEVAGKLRGANVGFGMQEHRVVFPPKATLLGKVLELCFVSHDGALVCQKFEAPGLPDLIWDNARKELFVVQVSARKTSCLPGTNGLGSQASMLKVWSKRDAECTVEYDDPRVLVAPVGVADTIAYRSDKWNKKNGEPDLIGSPEYVHQFDDGVFVEEPRRRSSNSAPKLALIHGGKLDVEAGGIVN
jgi:hypothetical protein